MESRHGNRPLALTRYNPQGLRTRRHRWRWAVALIGGTRFFSRIELSLTTQNQLIGSQAQDMEELKNETKKIAGVLTTIAVQDTRINRIEDDLRDLKHGKGFVTNGPPPS